MKKLIFALILALLTTAGCQEENTSDSQSPASRKTRLIAQENIELRRQIDQLEQQLETEKQNVAECKEEIDQIHLDYAQGHASTLEFLGKVSAEITELQKENKQLKEKLNMHE